MVNVPDRRDLLAECNADHHPLEEFNRECCSSCFNPECTRSLAGTTRFDKKALGWFDHYFQAPKMPDSDPRFPIISGQRFVMINPSRTPEVQSSWVDPRDITDAQVAPSVPVRVPSEPVQVLPTSGPSKDPPPKFVKKAVPTHLLLANAPSQAATLLEAPPSAPSSVQAPAKDPWAAPETSATSHLPIVQPGARVKVGGSGV